MSKRKNRRSSPNLPQATLDRARQQISGEAPPAPTQPVETTPDEAQAEAEPVITLTPAPYLAARRASATTSSSARPRSRRVQPAQAKGERKDTLDTEIIKNRLLHPTREVKEDQLRQEYSYVIKDLRAIAVIAAVMIALMVVVAQIT